MSEQPLPERGEQHVDLYARDPLSAAEPRFLRRLPVDDPMIGKSLREGDATYVCISAPHTMADCPERGEQTPDPTTMPVCTFMLSDAFYEELDHDGPTVDLWGSGPDGAQGFAALHALEQNGLPVASVALHWNVARGLPFESFWRIVLARAWPERAADQPMFIHGYQVNADA